MSDVMANCLPAAATGMPEAPCEAAGRMQIVVGVSGSPASALALRWAAAEADRLHAALTVVLVRTVEPRAHYAPAISADELDRRLERAVSGLAATMRAVAGYLPSDAVTMTVIEGLPERALLDQSAGADLLVLGSAATGNGDRPIGPVVRACLSRAHCPLVVVGPEGPTGHSRHDAASSHQHSTATQPARDLALAAAGTANAASGVRRSR
jgi:nucleotide-binding universal stress UspA family protein